MKRLLNLGASVNGRRCESNWAISAANRLAFSLFCLFTFQALGFPKVQQALNPGKTYESACVGYLKTSFSKQDSGPEVKVDLSELRFLDPGDKKAVDDRLEKMLQNSIEITLSVSEQNEDNLVGDLYFLKESKGSVTFTPSRQSDEFELLGENEKRFNNFLADAIFDLLTLINEKKRHQWSVDPKKLPSEYTKLVARKKNGVYMLNSEFYVVRE